ncbi:MAG: SusD/RagB family nutrient-binding outer membrane lipoprotein [Rikenellaceae bacterium]|nr:SusD/RagB family nutrient-binding outer membrane lipoprotein [Rikenellaceae bacterium]
MKKIFAGIMMLAAVAFTSCQEWLDVNNNIDAPDYVESHLYLSGIIQQFQGIYWDATYATNEYTRMMNGNSNYTGHLNPTASDTGGEKWRMTYWNQGMNLENMINQAVEAEQWTLAGIGYAIKAFSWDALTKYHGDVILTQAFEPGRTSFDYDYQDVVYAKVAEWYDTAIEYLTMEDNTYYGNKLAGNDWIYFGDKAKWVKFCYSGKIRQLSSLANKSNFVTEIAPELVGYADKAILSNADNATVTVNGGGPDEPYSAYNNFWGTARGNLGTTYDQQGYAVRVMTGTVPLYDENGNYVPCEDTLINWDSRYKNMLNPVQIICDTNVMEKGHYDPRRVAKLGTQSDSCFQNVENLDVIKRHRFFSDVTVWGRTTTSNMTTLDGQGRWLYHDAAPYILMNAAEIKFCVAEAYFRMGDKASALTWWKEAVADDMEFTASYLKPGKPAASDKEVTGGDKITKALFDKAAAEYLAGPFVGEMTAEDLTMSHIMMQKYVALYPWGSPEIWVDMRKNFYDVEYTGEYPHVDNGWTKLEVKQKRDDDPTKVFKGYYLSPANFEGYRGKFNENRVLEGSPCFRIRPRYNSEYMWNIPGLHALRPIPGDAVYYHCSIPWFCYPNGYPESYPGVTIE